MEASRSSISLPIAQRSSLSSSPTTVKQPPPVVEIQPMSRVNKVTPASPQRKAPAPSPPSGLTYSAKDDVDGSTEKLNSQVNNICSVIWIHSQHFIKARLANAVALHLAIYWFHSLGSFHLVQLSTLCVLAPVCYYNPCGWTIAASKMLFFICYWSSLMDLLTICTTFIISVDLYILIALHTWKVCEICEY